MNVFILDPVPKRAAQYHCDKHVVKMILECAQLLCTAHRLLDGSQFGRIWVHPNPELDRILYTATHINHPMAIWIRESAENYYWVYELMVELNNEFVRRYNKTQDHVTIQKLSKALSELPKNIRDIGFTQPPCCMPLELRSLNVVEAYREYYRKEKRAIAVWTDTPIPDWYHE